MPRPFPVVNPPEFQAGEATVKQESLEQSLNDLQQEARMVLPGIQALFGFQLIVIFNPGFHEKLSGADQRVHLVALILTSIAVLLVMAPAAYHRQVEPGRVSRRLVTLWTYFLTIGMAPLMLGLALDLYVVAKTIMNSWRGGLVVAGGMLLLTMSLWYLYPWVVRGRLGK